MRLPQDLLAEALWLESCYHGYLKKNKIPALLRQYNLKLRTGKTVTDVILAFGRGLKDTYGNASKQRNQIAEEIDKVCIIDRWDFAVGKYK